MSSVAAARALLAGLIEGGLTHLVLAPGSRSAPLVHAAAEAEARGEVTLTVRIDERVAAFTALGLATAGSGIVGVVTTSGTAVANLHPAALEAAAARTPLIAITADRPAELQGVGANQTVDQRGVFGAAPRWERTLEAGIDPAGARAAGLAAAAAASGRRSGVPGLAHINVRFREPLTPPPGAAVPAPLGGGRGPESARVEGESRFGGVVV
ncbi:MAG: hypothetical protein LBD97_08200, partial [Bifidobacteriaceae bacterium]|nr:hypothetical protein [Bifidobacteriaceae bacterium]